MLSVKRKKAEFVNVKFVNANTNAARGTVLVKSVFDCRGRVWARILKKCAKNIDKREQSCYIFNVNLALCVHEC